jgi:predicted acylesterase/phospholipase RssA
VRDEIGLRPERISAVSGGALTGAGFITRRGKRVLDTMCAAFADLDSNIDPHEVTTDDGLSAHQRLYREIVADVFDATARREIADGPVFQVLIGHPPTGKLSKFTGTAATLAYEAELHAVGSPHFEWAETVGVTSTQVDARKAAKDGKLVDLICAAAVIPPLFDLAVWDGKPVIDGGMADQAPMPEPDKGSTLILLTRDYSAVPEVDGCTYISPSSETQADKVDFTDPAKIRRAWQQGEADGRKYLDRIRRHPRQTD